MRLNEHGNTAKDYRRANELRNNASPVEQKLWRVLREAAAARNLKFRRQQAIHPFIADFACMEARLLVELDGDTHAGREGYDKARDRDLRQRGFFVLRFSNDDVVNNVEGVVETILVCAEELIRNGDVVSRDISPLPNPSPQGGGAYTVFVAKEGQNVED